MRVEELIGQRVQTLRKNLNDGKEITQEELGARLEPFLGKRWSRQAVSAAEAGQRAFTAVELVALAAVLGTNVAALFALPSTEIVVMPGGREISPDSFDRLARERVTQDSIQGRIIELSENLAVANQSLRLITQGLRATNSALDTSNEAVSGLLRFVEDGAR
ncbi:helix-turn-helix domain-containing protein [Rhodococcus opacus]|uniref:helix-turn-helix domain-containing protein n=1 Tax=Rhodococcus opacus TaxID=37919 RepID=UPI0024B970CC|nr:helix-turn-helix transcriptional regulator [Rhodococcus opacus]MDJ0413829.1 helix-turn-helix transcriptional regulator [Rhodococcus opacus]